MKVWNGKFLAVILSAALLVSLFPPMTFAMDSSSTQENKTLETPYEYGSLIDVGTPVVTVKTTSAASDNGEFYFATNGAPSTFYALNAETGETLFSQKIVGNNTISAITVAADGDVYFAGQDNGVLYRYVRASKTVETLGVNPSDRFVWDVAATSDGKLYGATYPNSKVFEYDMDTKTFRDLGSMKEGVKYARGIGVTDTTIYVGIGNPVSLYKIDRATGAKTEVMLPNSGANDMIADIWSYNGRLFVRSGATTLFILNEETEEVIHSLPWPEPNRFDSMISPPSPVHPELIYYRNVSTNELVTYNTNTDEIIPLEGVILPNSTVKTYEWITPETGEYGGKTILSMITEKLEHVKFDPTDQSISVSQPNVEAQGIEIQSLEIGPDGKMYMGGYHTSFTVYDTERSAYDVQERIFPQIEGIGFLNDKVYLGTYGGAVMYEYDPTKPYQKDLNPVLAHDMEVGQSRPFAFATGENQLFVGTIADYGLVKGALSMYDALTDQWTVFADIVENQSVMSLAYMNGLVYGGSTIHGGGGTNPASPTAKMFVFDPETQTKITEFTPQIPGMNNHTMIGGLSEGPDGLLWGITYGTVSEGVSSYSIFAMDPDTYELKKSKVMYQGASSGSQWRPYFMRWGEDGLLYTTIGRSLTVFNPETLDSKKLVESTSLMAIADDGGIFYSQGANLKLLPVPLEQVELDAERTVLPTGEQVKADLNAVLGNGKPATMSRAKIQYSTSDASIASVSNEGGITAISHGVAQITATVVLDGFTVASNALIITVNEVSVTTLQQKLTELIQSGDVRKPLANQLENSLKQVAHHESKGHVKQAVEFLEKFIDTLTDEKMSKHVEAEAKEALLLDGNALLLRWQ